MNNSPEGKIRVNARQEDLTGEDILKPPGRKRQICTKGQQDRRRLGVSSREEGRQRAERELPPASRLPSEARKEGLGASLRREGQWGPGRHTWPPFLFLFFSPTMVALKTEFPSEYEGRPHRGNDCSKRNRKERAARNAVIGDRLVALAADRSGVRPLRFPSYFHSFVLPISVSLAQCPSMGKFLSFFSSFGKKQN